MHKYLIIDLKSKLFSTISVIALGIILTMYISECLPKKWYWYAEPMDEMHLIYTTLKEDYAKGKTDEFKVNGAVLINSITLNQTMAEKMKDTILHLNPHYSKNEKISDVVFRISDIEYRKLMEDLNYCMGGTSYYSEHNRNLIYFSYIQNAYGVDASLTKTETLNAMEDYLNGVLSSGTYYKFKIFGLKKHILRKNEKLYLGDIRGKMKEVREENDNWDIIYQQYNACFLSINQLLGGDTAFGTKYRYCVFNVNNTMKKATENYRVIRDKEKITNTYARYYSDYMVILAGILPALFGAFTLVEDRRFRMQELVYPRAIPSLRYVFAKFFSIVTVFMMYFYLIAAISTVLFYRFGQKYNLVVDNFAFMKYTTFWVMPSVLITTALSMFISILFMNGIVALMLQIIIFFLSAKTMIGNYQIWKPIIRFNEIGYVEIYRKNLSAIVANRAFATIVSIILIFITAKIFNIVRGSGFSMMELFHRILSAGKDKSKDCYI